MNDDSHRGRRGFATQAILYFVGSLVVIGLLGWLLIGLPEEENGPDEIILYCAAGIQKPVAEAAKLYAEEEFGVPVRIEYGGSGTLLTSLQVGERSKRGDLYLAADESYIEIARKKGLLAEAIPLAMQRPVIAVKKGNPKKIKSVADLLRSDVKFALAIPGQASIGKLTKQVLTKTGEWKRIEEKATVFKPTVNDIISDIDIGAVDAAIVWEANVVQLSHKFDMVHTKPFDAAKQTITIGVLKWSQNSAAALRFARYLQAPEKGQKQFKKHGYEAIPNADHWAVKPTIQFSSGGVNRVAIEKTLAEFKKREGVEINVKYNGCGIIVGEILGGARPDAYFSCDASFLAKPGIPELFLKPVTLSETDMVVIVKKGNPEGIKSLHDLERSGLRVGVANPKQSALGELTVNLLSELNLLQGVSKNISVRTPTEDL
ncbi:MAG: molybdate ABC transporter substrate-binding protein, partial [Planctomycetes bacterium]|nr:molybdate ABC transporter substrate-binding protein [Planctomycetota bacterium]